MSTTKDLAEGLSDALARSDMTRQQLAEVAGVSRQALYRLLKGQDVQVSTLLSVMDVLELDLTLVPKVLRRGLPEFEPSAPAAGTSPARAAEPSPAPVVHAPSAVQQRLAALRAGGATVPTGKAGKGRA